MPSRSLVPDLTSMTYDQGTPESPEKRRSAAAISVPDEQRNRRCLCHGVSSDLPRNDPESLP